jgi:anti-anti-sigma factor
MAKSGAIRVDSSKRGSYTLFSIEQDLNLYSDISHLRELVQKSISIGEHTIALRFSQDSYFSSQTVAMLVNCIEMVKECSGKIALVNPNHNLRYLLTIIDLDSAIQVFDSESNLIAPVN